MELKTNETDAKQLAALWQQLFACIRLQAKLDDPAAAHASEMLANPDETEADHELEARGLLALRGLLAAKGLELQPAATVTRLRLHCHLDGDVSIRVLLGAKPFLLDGEEADSGCGYDAYACCRYEYDLDSESDRLHLDGFMFEDELAERMSLAGHVYTAPVHPPQESFKRLLALAEQEQQELAAIAPPQGDVDEGEPWPAVRAELEATDRLIDTAWDAIQQAVLNGARCVADLPAKLQEALAAYPVLTKRMERELAWLQYVRSIPAEVWDRAEQRAQQRAADLRRRALEAQRASRWEQLLGQLKAVLPELRTARKADYDDDVEPQAQETMAAFNAHYQLLPAIATKGPRRGAVKDAEETTAEDVAEKLTELRSALGKYEWPSTELEKLTALLDEMEALLNEEA